MLNCELKINQDDDDDFIIGDTGIKNPKFCYSKIVPMYAIKWDPVKDATHYVVSFSNNSPKQTTDKPSFRLSDDFDFSYYPYVQAFKGGFPLTRKQPFRRKLCSLVILG